MQEPSDERAGPSGSRRATIMRRTLTRHHGLPTKPLRTSICVDISCAEWSEPAANLFSFDARIQDAEARAHYGNTFVIKISGPRTDLRRVSKQVFARYQRFFQRRNAGSRSKLFTAALQHRYASTPFDEAVAKAVFEHALDVWQWTLRIDPQASTAVQLAALFHVAESGCPNCRVAPDEDERSLAVNTGELTLKTLLEEIQSPHELISAATSRIRRHQEGPECARDRNDPDGILLHDADGLSFLSLGTPSLSLSSGAHHTEDEIKHRLACLSPRARSWIPVIGLSPFVHELVNEALPVEERAGWERSTAGYAAPTAASAL